MNMYIKETIKRFVTSQINDIPVMFICKEYF